MHAGKSSWIMGVTQGAAIFQQRAAISKLTSKNQLLLV